MTGAMAGTLSHALMPALGGGMVALASGCLLLMRAQERAARAKLRMAALVAPYRDRRAAGDRPAARLTSVRPAAGQNRIGAMFRYMPVRAAYYPASPLLVASVTALLAFIIALLLYKTFGQVGLVSGPVLWVVFCRSAYQRFNDSVATKLRAQFPDALAAVVRIVRVGVPVPEAIGMVAKASPSPTSEEFLRASNRMAMGITLPEAAREMAERSLLAEYRFFATALALQSQTGGGLAETLENLADTIRKRAAARARGHALASEARSSSYVLAALPIVTGGLLAVFNPHYVAVLFTDPAGRKLLATGVMFLCMGMFTMRTIISRSLS